MRHARQRTKASPCNLLLTALALLALLAPAGLAQNAQHPAKPPAPTPPPTRAPLNDKGTIRAAVDLVEVDVEITDRNGKPIKGLTQDQFTVSEDGKEQKLSTFDYYDVEKIEKAGPGDNAPATVPVTVSIGGVA